MCFEFFEGFDLGFVPVERDCFPCEIDERAGNHRVIGDKVSVEACEA
jgi:hypothetical protein